MRASFGSRPVPCRQASIVRAALAPTREVSSYSLARAPESKQTRPFTSPYKNNNGAHPTNKHTEPLAIFQLQSQQRPQILSAHSQQPLQQTTMVPSQAPASSPTYIANALQGFKPPPSGARSGRAPLSPATRLLLPPGILRRQPLLRLCLPRRPCRNPLRIRPLPPLPAHPRYISCRTSESKLPHQDLPPQRRRAHRRCLRGCAKARLET